MEIFNLPRNCRTDKNIPKEIIYKNAQANQKLKKIFINNIEKIRSEYALTYTNSNIETFQQEDEKYQEIHFIKIVLKEKGKEKTICEILHQLIPKGTVFILEFQQELLISVAIKKIGTHNVILKRIYDSGWLDKNEESLQNLDYRYLNSTNMKFLYESIIEKIRILKLSKNGQNITKDNIEKLEMINKEITELKKLRKKENQIDRIVEIQTKLFQKIKVREDILKNK